MKRRFSAVLFSGLCAATVGLSGCTSQTEAETAVMDPKASSPTSEGSGSSGGVTPMTTGAGAITPVTGNESLQGSGGYGVGQAAKDRAKAVGQTAPSSISQSTESGD